MPVGIDIGSRYLKIAVLGSGNGSLHTTYVRHEGRPLEVLKEASESLGLASDAKVGLTGSGADAIGALMGLPLTDFTKATVRGVRREVPGVRNIIDVGASSVTLIELDETGNLRDFATNSMCAAGTGSFLDAQATRLGLDMEDRAGLEPVLEPPTIATRCAVFAKSDLIHRQQEGYDKDALWCGLCRGLSGTLLQTLLRGKPLQGLTVVTGGVAKNGEVLRWLQEMGDAEIRTFSGAEFAAALGAAEIASENSSLVRLDFTEIGESPEESRTQLTRPPLRLDRTRYPSFDVAESWSDDLDNEIRLTSWPSGAAIEAYLGIDVGSTSTKAVVVDESGSVLVDIYRKTAGDPVGATKALFTALNRIVESRETQLDILACGTTGSGRKLVGAVVGADDVVNEITAHLAGAAAGDPEVDTIFEIGGQDSKYIRVQDGMMRDSNMNYVCAAGTGSFVEEQAIKLGYGVEEIGPLVLGVSPPHTSDRCTVFMEQDVERMVRQGYSPQEALAAVMYSVVENYLAKVVGNRPYSREKVFFCGATARNQGLVAAFEQLLGAEVVVSPYCHVLGAYGVALLTRDRQNGSGATTRFKGLDLSERQVTLTQEECPLCQNACRITYAHIEGEKDVPSWGYLCGRDPEADEKRKCQEYQPFRLRTALMARAYAEHRQQPAEDAVVVGVPSTLSTFSHGPLWQVFLSNLGSKVRMSRPTDDATKDLASSVVGSEYCFPAKVAHGHVARLLEDPEVAYVFMPHTVSEPVPEEHTNAFFCPVVCALPAMAQAALNVAGREGADRILSPQIDLRWDRKRQQTELVKRLAEPLGCKPKQIRKAWDKALEAQEAFETSLQEEGRRELDELRDEGKPAILCLGRAYNLFDGGANLELPLKVAEQGFTVIPGEFAPIDDVELGEELRNIYWVYGQRLLKGLLWARNQKNVFPIWFTNFKCGPDSFLLTYAEWLMGDKPFLILELDEHGGDAGYMTRIEAFLDVVRGMTDRTETEEAPSDSVMPRLPIRSYPEEAYRERTIWVPPGHSIGAPLAAAAMRGEGFDARPLPEEDDETLAVGRQVTRGGECIPMTVTIGRLLQTLREKGGDGSTDGLFMPSACGPCRFGQYNLLEQVILDREGFGELAIMSPNNDNAYQGLPEKLRRKIWTGILLGDILFKVGCRFRPYASDPSAIDDFMDAAQKIMERAFESGESLKPAFARALAPFREIPKPPSDKPLVGVVGEIFVRCNAFSNQNVVRAIEAQGGEAWLAPFHEWVLYACWEHERRAKVGLDILGKAKSYVKNRYLFETEHAWYMEAGDLLGDRHEPSVQESAEAAYPYASFNFGGEVLMTIGRTIEFFKQGASV
jgi:predicted CoA-substrate-specific enzyme activase